MLPKLFTVLLAVLATVDGAPLKAHDRDDSRDRDRREWKIDFFHGDPSISAVMASALGAAAAAATASSLLATPSPSWATTGHAAQATTTITPSLASSAATPSPTPITNTTLTSTLAWVLVTLPAASISSAAVAAETLGAASATEAWDATTTGAWDSITTSLPLETSTWEAQAWTVEDVPASTHVESATALSALSAGVDPVPTGAALNNWDATTTTMTTTTYTTTTYAAADDAATTWSAETEAPTVTWSYVPGFAPSSQTYSEEAWAVPTPTSTSTVTASHVSPDQFLSMAFDATWRYTSGSLSAIDTTPTPTPTTTTPARTPGPISGDTSLALLEAMNKARKDYGVSPISWTSGLSKKAWTQAQHCSWDYSFPNVQDQYPDAQVAVAMTTPLVDGITNGFLSPAYAYNYSTPGVDGDNVYARGLTQIVWRQTKAVGCAWNKCTGLTGFGANEDAQLITCWFDAQGTYLPGNTVSFELNMPLKLTA